MHSTYQPTGKAGNMQLPASATAVAMYEALGLKRTFKSQTLGVSKSKDEAGIGLILDDGCLSTQ